MDKPVMDYILLVDTAVLAGEIMLENGAETYRVEETISHFLKRAHLKHAHAFVTATGIVATLSDPSMEAITVVRRVERYRTNLNRIYLVNNISRKFAEHELELEEAFRELKRTRKLLQYSQTRAGMGVVLTTAFFTLLLGGTPVDCMVSALMGSILAGLMQIGRRVGIKGFLLDGVNTMIVVFCALLVGHLMKTPVNTDLIIIGGIMPMVPGVAITNAVRDTLQGDYVSGGARMLEACMEAVAIAFGACVAMSAYFGLLFRHANF
jgi:uncharacterized membrane protein YjjP (DUF1212 family)